MHPSCSLVVFLGREKRSRMNYIFTNYKVDTMGVYEVAFGIVVL